MKHFIFRPLSVLALLFFLVSCRSAPCLTCPPSASDTTSHNFTWTTQTLGVHGILYDVAIINDTCIIAVGEIYVLDSAGNAQYPPYSIAKWDGRKWELKTLYYDTYSPIFPIRGIAVAGPNDIWLAAGSIFHWDGISSLAPMSFSRLTLTDPNATVNKIWGSSRSCLYGVGNAGTALFYNGTRWQKILSGTTLDIYDIWGARNLLGQWQIIAIASSSQSSENALLEIQPDNTVNQLNITGLSPFSTGIWFMPQAHYYVVGSGIHQKSSLDDPSWKVYAPGEVTSYASSAIYGQSLNDIFVVGSFLEVVHFNGATWYNYRKEIPFSSVGVFAAVKTKGNTVIMVGFDNQVPLVVIGRR